MKAEKKACASCGRPIPATQEYPYPGHRPDCAFVASWTAAHKVQKEEARLARKAAKNKP